MRVRHFMGVVLSVLALAACGPMYRTDYTMVPPPTDAGRMCANNCLMAKNNCAQTCSLQQGNCENMQRLEAQNQYLQYVNERQRAGQPVKKTVNDFFGYSSCGTDYDCEGRCQNDYHICHGNCGGQVIPRTYCVANCG